MAKIIFLQLPTSIGHFNPTKKIMNDLSAQGNEVICYGSANQFKYFDNNKITQRNYILYDKSNLQYPTVNANLNEAIKLIYERIIINKFHLSNIIGTIEKEIPDLVIYDEWLSILGYYIESELGIKCYCSNTKMAYSDYLLTNNETGIKKCLGIPLKCSEKYENLLTELDNYTKYLSDIHHVPFERAQYYFSSKGKNNLIFNYPSFQPFYETFDDTYHFVGASFENRVCNTEKPIDVYVSFGTVNNDNLELLNLIIKTLDSLKLSSVISIGNKLSIGMLTSYDKNRISVFKSVNQLDILSKSKIFITHGGMNSTIEAITLNVPIIVIPQEGDQFIVADEVNHVGIGKVFKHIPQPNELSDIIKQLLKGDIRCEIIKNMKNVSEDKRTEKINLI